MRLNKSGAIIIIHVNGNRHECQGPVVQIQTDAGEQTRPATVEETVQAIQQGYGAKAGQMTYVLKSGGMLILGPMAAARASVMVVDAADYVPDKPRGTYGSN